jgi:hypothetical protein
MLDSASQLGLRRVAQQIAKAGYHLRDASTTAGPLDSGVAQERSSLEVRWVIPGRMQAAMAGWFAHFAVEVESREDLYLLHPQSRTFSVKIRGGRALEVKVYRGSPGVIDVPGRALGRMEFWQKWSWPCNQLGDDGGTIPAGWTLVNKRRQLSRFPLAADRRSGSTAPDPGVSVELTKIHGPGGQWWSLGLEATGPGDLLHRQLEATAARVFAEPLPGGLAFGPDDSCSYAEWLRRQVPVP